MVYNKEQMDKYLNWLECDINALRTRIERGDKVLIHSLIKVMISELKIIHIYANRIENKEET